MLRGVIVFAACRLIHALPSGLSDSNPVIIAKDSRDEGLHFFVQQNEYFAFFVEFIDFDLLLLNFAAQLFRVEVIWVDRHRLLGIHWPVKLPLFDAYLDEVLFARYFYKKVLLLKQDHHLSKRSIDFTEPVQVRVESVLTQLVLVLLSNFEQFLYHSHLLSARLQHRLQELFTVKLLLLLLVYRHIESEVVDVVGHKLNDPLLIMLNLILQGFSVLLNTIVIELVSEVVYLCLELFLNVTIRVVL